MLIERCLDKDPRERLRDIGEARIALTRTPSCRCRARDRPGGDGLIQKSASPFESRMSGNGRTLLIERPGLEAEVWLMEFKK